MRILLVSKAGSALVVTRSHLRVIAVGIPSDWFLEDS